MKKMLLSRSVDSVDKEVTTIPAIASTLDCSYGFVRLRLTNSPGVFRVGNKYRIRKLGVVEFIED